MNNPQLTSYSHRVRHDGSDLAAAAATSYSWASLVAQRIKRLLQCRRPGFNPWVGKSPWRRKWQSTPVFLTGESHGERSLESTGSQSQTQLSDFTHTHTHTHTHTQHHTQW